MFRITGISTVECLRRPDSKNAKRYIFLRITGKELG
jgi:hypothetical protein